MNNKIAFLDFEFGVIYGSHRRDFLITEAAVLIYDINNNKLSLGEVIFKPDTNLVFRKKVKNKTITNVHNLNQNKMLTFDKEFKILNSERKIPRKMWNKRFYSKLTTFLNSSLKDINTIYVFGGNEDINLLNRYNIKYNEIKDLQSILHKWDRSLFPEQIKDKINKKQQCSLEFYVKHLALYHSIENNKLNFGVYSYQIPKNIKSFNYSLENLKAHNASGDCLRLFSIYKTLLANN